LVALGQQVEQPQSGQVVTCLSQKTRYLYSLVQVTTLG